MADSSAGLQIELLGPVEARVDGRPVALGGQRPRALFAVLALMGGRVVTTDRLIDELWGEDPPVRARDSLQVHVSRLRKGLDDAGADGGRLVSQAGGYLLDLRPGERDVDRWQQALRRARRARANAEARVAREEFEQALGVWRGQPLGGVSTNSLLAAERARLEEERLAAVIEGIELDLELGRHGELLGQLDALVIAHPFKERLVELQMLALYRCGRQTDALEIYAQNRRRLDAELGLEPSSQLRRLQEAILRQDPSLEAAIGDPIPQGQPEAARPSLPAQLQPRPLMPFVGRAAEVGQLAALPDRARTDGRQIALVGGEPGSGKTRLAREFAEHVTSSGVSVLYGACDPAVRTPYQPLVEALEPALAGLDADEPEPGAGRYPASLTRLLPGLRARAGDPTPAIADAETEDPDAERHELHAALTALLARLARDAPAVLVLDDVQWADASSLMLLRHLARSLGATPTVVLALFREGAGELPDALASTLAELHRLDGVVRVRLGGLDVADVQELVHRSGDSVRGGDGELAEQLVGLTDGNAFLVGEVWRHMLDREGVAGRSSPADATIPESVREVMAARVAGLTPALGELVQLIAVSPRGIALPVLRVAARMDDDSLLGALDEGLHTGMLEEIRDASLVYRVRHELLRRTVYERLSSVRAAALHLRLGEALEAMPEGRRDRIVNELAFHFRAAAPIAGNGRAVEYALDAAAQAERSLAFAEAAGRFEEALALGVPDLSAEAEVRCRQGRAWHLAGRPAEALESFAAAAAAARECGDGALQARAAIGFETACWRPGIDDPRAVALLREAALGVAAEPSALRVRVLAHLSRALAYRREHAAAGECWSRAVAMARLVADPGALMVALSHAAWTRGSRGLDEILADLTEAGALARTLPHDYLSDVVRGMRIALLIEAFAIDEARADNAALRELSERAGQPFLARVVEQHDALLALCDGRLDAAEAAANRSHEIARRTERGPSAVHGIQMFSIRREQGRLAEIAPLVRLIASGQTEADSLWRPALAVLLAEIGDVESARRELEALVDADLRATLRGGLGVGGLTYAAEACALIEDAALAAPIYEQLLVFEGQNTVIGSAVACYGAADRMLGALATVMQQWDDAERHLENALVLNRRMGSPTWIAHTLHERARLTLRRGGPHELELTRERASEALDAARRIGLRGLVARIERLTASLPAPTAADDLSAREVEVLRAVARGLSNREAAAMLHLSEHTVAHHLRSVLRKTGCANRTQATTYAVRHGIAET
jgi:DNA-binding SARP family transcriptional activator/DNA-binding CsgD family transcriptional regulator/tetratricopeptide (TPR) repeat protein